MKLQDINPIYKVVLHLKAGQTVELLMKERPEIDLTAPINLQGADPSQSPEVVKKEVKIQANEASAFEIIDNPKGI